MKNTNAKRRRSAAIAIVCAVMVLVTGTFAWQTVSQWALGQAIGAEPEIGVVAGRLHNTQQVMGANFGEHVWQQGSTSDKSIFVENFGEEHDIFVRVRLYEYMEIGQGARLHPGQPGFATRAAQSIITGADREDVTTWAPRVPQSNAASNLFRAHWGWTQGGQRVFMPTFNKDIRSLETDVKGDAWSLRDLGPGEVINSTHPGQPAPHAFPAEAGLNDFFEVGDTHEALVKYWDETLNGGAGGHAITTFTEEHTAKNTLPATTMLMSAWNGETGNFWVLDTDGWAYWAAPLAPGEATGLLLADMTLINAPAGEWYYGIHANAEMAVAGDLPMAWEGDRPTLTADRLINRITGRGNPAAGVALGGTFTDSEGIVWRVLNRDDDGNRLIITQHVHGVGTPYHSVNTFVRLHDSDRLRPALNEWFGGIAPEVMRFALPAENLENDVRSVPGGTAPWAAENSAAGWTSAGEGVANGENALFVLSVSEANRYASVLNLGAPTTGGSSATWWLRSPGAAGSVANVNWDGALRGAAADGNATSTSHGFRPAMWISP